VIILAINAVIIELVLKKQAHNDTLVNKGQVTISSAELSRLGINRGTISESGVQLLVAPDAQFKGKLGVAGATNLSGELTLNGKLTGTDASFSQLQAGKTSLSELNVNGNGTLNSLNLRKDLVVSGLTQLQGPVTLNQLLTINNNLNVSGNLAIGGTLAVNIFSVRNITVAGHIISSGPTPAVGRGGSALGSNGTVSISGNDAAGTIAINIGAGATSGTLANVSFRTQYGGVPRVVITPIGIGANFYVLNSSIGGFSVGVGSGLPPGGYRIDYIIEQ
jgi:hypothetical protein